MSVSWKISEAAAGQGDRAYLETGLRSFADTIYEATEGRFKVCKVFVFDKRRNWGKADVVAEAKGRANAALGALREDSGQIRMFREIDPIGGGPAHQYGAAVFGKVLAHEFGHYGLFLRDEYTEPQEAVPNEPPYLRPRPCDVQVQSLMGNPHSITALSLDTDYTGEDHPAWTLKEITSPAPDQRTKYLTCDKLDPPPKGAPNTETAQWRTAHYRHYQKSAWRLLVEGPTRELLAREARSSPAFVGFPSIAEGGVPAKLKYPTFDGSCFQAIIMDGDYAVLAIDRSASMAKPNALNVPLVSLAVAAAKDYVTSAPAGTTIAVLEFASDVTVVVPPTKIPLGGEAPARAQINAAIDALAKNPPAGNTSLDAALMKARDLLLEGSAIGNSQYVVAISDGEVATQSWLLGQLVGLNIPVFTVAVRDAGSSVMQDVARQTGGAHRNAKGWSQPLIEAELKMQEPVGVRLYPASSSNAPLEAPTELSERDGATVFRASWKEGDKAVFELVTPDAGVVTPANLPPGISYEPSLEGASYVIASPVVGKYTPRLVPQSTSTGDRHIWARSDSRLSLSVDTVGGKQYPEPWFVRARLAAPQPVLGASVTGTLTSSVAGAAPHGVAFRDDGQAPDEQPEDGVYTAVIADVVEDGDYTLDVLALNPGGATVDPIGVGDDPGGADPAAPLSSFRREASLTLKAQGRFAMPQSPAGAVQVRNDLTPVWVSIDHPGDVVWLEFNGYKKGWYVAMTGGLIANDAGPMATRLTLYDTDGATELESDAQPDGRARVEVHTPGIDGKYYLKVEHTSGGVGRFQVAVAPGEWFQKRSGTRSGGGGEGGCRLSRSSDSTGVVAFGTWLGLFVLRRTRKPGGPRRRRGS